MRAIVTYDRRKVGLLAVVYASQGIAPGFAYFAMPTLLLKQGVPLRLLGFTGLLILPVAFKFLWGPWSDRLAARGRIRAWMSALQITLAATIAALAALPPARGVAPFLVAVGVAYLTVAVLDTLTDGVAVRLLAPEERPLGNAAQWGGFYAGSILAGGLFLAIEPRIGWGPAMSLLALLVVAGWAAGRALPPTPAVSLQGAAPRPSLLAFVRSPAARGVIPLLLLLDLPQNVGIYLVGAFLVANGLSQAQSGLVSGILGLLAAVGGAALGGVVLGRLSRIHAVFLTAALQALPMFGFAWLALHPGPSLGVPVAVTCAASALASLFNVALCSWFMDQTSPTQPATDYSLMASAHTVSVAIASPIAGASAAALGYPVHFTMVGAVALLLVLVAWPWLRRLARPVYAPVVPATAAPAAAD